MNVKLNGLTHTFPDDVDVLLVSPAGKGVVLMANTGGGDDVTDVNLTFSDQADQSLPDEDQTTSGTYKPTRYSFQGVDFSAPAPAHPYVLKLSAFDCQKANGTWKLYVLDDTGFDAGQITDGWSPALLDIPSSWTALTILARRSSE